MAKTASMFTKEDKTRHPFIFAIVQLAYATDEWPEPSQACCELME